jgi:hypothetical protein
MVADATEDIGKPGAWIKVIQAGRDDQRLHRGRAITPTV